METMKIKLLSGLLIIAAMHVPILSFAQEPPIDFEKARQIMERNKRGENVTADERAYVQRAMKARQDGQAKQPAGKNAGGLPTPPPKWTQHLTPLTELGSATYKGEDGGLYGGGKNVPPAAHLAAALKE